MLGYLNGISFLGYNFQSYPNSQKISLNILTYPYISYHIPTYPKISSGANSQMNFDYSIAVFRRVADDLRCSKRVTRIMHDTANVGMLCHAQVK